MGVRVIVPNKAKTAKRICKNKEVGLFAATTCAKEMKPYVPARDLILCDNYQLEPFKVIYNVPYAHYQWNGISSSGKPLHYSKNKHARATKKWDEVTGKEKGEKIARQITNYMKRV